MNTELRHYFNTIYRKDELADLLIFFDIEISRSAKKAELVDIATAYVGGDPASWLFKLPERDLRLLSDLVRAGADEWLKYDAPEFPTILEGLKLIVVEDNHYEDVVALLPLPIYSIICPFVDMVIEDKERFGLFEAERLGLGLMNIYGAIPVDDFLSIIYDIVGDDHELALNIVRNPLIAAQRTIYKDEMYVVSPYALDCEHVVENRKPFNKKIRKYVSCTREQAISAGTGAPYCAYGTGTEAAEGVLSVLEGLGLTRAEALKELHEIWFNAQFTMEQVCTEAMFRCVNDKIDEISSFTEYRRIVDTIAAYANNMPKWLLKGRSSEASDMLKLSIKVDETIFEDAAHGDDDTTYDGSFDNVMSGPFEQFYKQGIGVRHVMPDAPCPCGSGLSYKNCHGRKLS